MTRSFSDQAERRILFFDQLRHGDANFTARPAPRRRDDNASRLIRSSSFRWSENFSSWYSGLCPCGLKSRETQPASRIETSVVGAVIHISYLNQTGRTSFSCPSRCQQF